MTRLRAETMHSDVQARITDTFFIKNGAVAQLGERQNRTLEVGGSTPLCSTKFLNLIMEGGIFAADRQSS